MEGGTLKVYETSMLRFLHGTFQHRSSVGMLCFSFPGNIYHGTRKETALEGPGRDGTIGAGCFRAGSWHLGRAISLLSFRVSQLMNLYRELRLSEGPSSNTMRISIWEINGMV